MEKVDWKRVSLGTINPNQPTIPGWGAERLIGKITSYRDNFFLIF